MATVEIAPASWQWHGFNDIDEPDSRHMTTDASIFEAVEQGALPATIRCYTWQRPAITIGRLQDEAFVCSEFPGMPIYRRPTGGKAVQHGDDLTICVSASNVVLSRLSDSNKLDNLYTAIVNPVRSTLADFGTDTRFGQTGTGKCAGYDGEDCFRTAARCDVVDLRGIKVLGSAMRRSSKAVIVQMALRPLVGIDVTGHDFTGELRNSYMRFIQIGR